MKWILGWAAIAGFLVVVFGAISEYNHQQERKHRWSDEELHKLELR